MHSDLVASRSLCSPGQGPSTKKGVGRKRGGGVRRGDRVERLVKDIRLGVREISMRIPDTR